MRRCWGLKVMVRGRSKTMAGLTYREPSKLHSEVFNVHGELGSRFFLGREVYVFAKFALTRSSAYSIGVSSVENVPCAETCRQRRRNSRRTGRTLRSSYTLGTSRSEVLSSQSPAEDECERPPDTRGEGRQDR